MIMHNKKKLTFGENCGRGIYMYADVFFFLLPFSLFFFLCIPCFLFLSLSPFLHFPCSQSKECTYQCMHVYSVCHTSCESHMYINMVNDSCFSFIVYDYICPMCRLSYNAHVIIVIIIILCTVPVHKI